MQNGEGGGGIRGNRQVTMEVRVCDTRRAGGGKMGGVVVLALKEQSQEGG